MEDLEDLGFYLLGHQKRLTLALRRLRGQLRAPGGGGRSGQGGRWGRSEGGRNEGGRSECGREHFSTFLPPAPRREVEVAPSHRRSRVQTERMARLVATWAAEVEREEESASPPLPPYPSPPSRHPSTPSYMHPTPSILPSTPLSLLPESNPSRLPSSAGHRTTPPRPPGHLASPPTVPPAHLPPKGKPVARIRGHPHHPHHHHPEHLLPPPASPATSGCRPWDPEDSLLCSSTGRQSSPRRGGVGGEERSRGEGERSRGGGEGSRGGREGSRGGGERSTGGGDRGRVVGERSRGDVLEDIGCMLSDLTRELDSMMQV